TRHVKASETGANGAVHLFDRTHETFHASHVAADAQFVLQVKAHNTFGSDELLAEALFFVDDQGASAGKERSIKVGTGFVTLSSGFTMEGTTSGAGVGRAGSVSLNGHSGRPSSSYSRANNGGADGDMMGVADGASSSPESRRGVPKRLFSSRRGTVGDRQ
ncbi:hypothetical protein KEM55_001415, partial [Ascosphaera atra]